MGNLLMTFFYFPFNPFKYMLWGSAFFNWFKDI
jgi:hypothetical protein